MIEKPEDYLGRADEIFRAHMESAINQGLVPESGREKPGKKTERKKSAADKKYLNDPLVQRIAEYINSPHHLETERNTAVKDISDLLGRYKKVNSRLNKIVVITDNYQAQLRDLTMQMELMAHTDFLTGLPNRRSIIERIEVELSRAERYSTVFSLILFDIDNFKYINDNYGHETGDEVLKVVGSKLRKCFRKADTCARWGGEEFLVLCPESDDNETWKAGEKCRIMIADSEISVGSSTHKITLSGGVSSYKTGISLNTLLTNIDNSLYRAKNTGKNRLLRADL